MRRSPLTSCGALPVRRRRTCSRSLAGRILPGRACSPARCARGYGPAGAGFIAHVDVPAEVTAAWARLREAFPGSVRVAVPSYAS